MLYNKDWAYKLNPVADVLLKAADLLEQRGHTKWTRVDNNGRMCFLGALAVAQGHALGWETSLIDCEVTMEASRVVAKALGCKPRVQRIGFGAVEIDYRGTMVDWNNKEERTGQEVIDVMRKTASNLMEKADAV